MENRDYCRTYSRLSISRLIWRFDHENYTIHGTFLYRDDYPGGIVQISDRCTDERATGDTPLGGEAEMSPIK